MAFDKPINTKRGGNLRYMKEWMVIENPKPEYVSNVEEISHHHQNNSEFYSPSTSKPTRNSQIMNHLIKLNGSMGNIYNRVRLFDQKITPLTENLPDFMEILKEHRKKKELHAHIIQKQMRTEVNTFLKSFNENKLDANAMQPYKTPNFMFGVPTDSNIDAEGIDPFWPSNSFNRMEDIFIEFAADKYKINEAKKKNSPYYKRFD